MKVRNRTEYRHRRHKRIRQRILGTSERPRMTIMISNRGMNVQFIDDERGATVAAVSYNSRGAGKNNIAAAKELGVKAAEAAKAAGIKIVTVDRAGFKFHGRIEALVESMNHAGVSSGMKEEK